MTIGSNSPFKQNKPELKPILVALISLTLIATPAISMPSPNTKILNDTFEDEGYSSTDGCSVEILKPAIGTGYLFDAFEFPLLLITLSIVIGGITCTAEVNVTTEEPNYLQWKFANFLGDEFWSYPIPYQSGVTKYEYYMGKVNFGQFKIWIYCYDINNNVICVNTISCLKIL